VSQRCFIALGANLGDPVVTVKAAILALRELPQTQFVAASSLYRTAPVGLKHQPDFINAVVELVAASSAPDLLESLFSIEACFGRLRSVKNALASMGAPEFPNSESGMPLMLAKYPIVKAFPAPGTVSAVQDWPQ